MNTTFKASLLAAALAITIGCGGGGAGSGSNVSTGQKVGFFVTSTSGQYSHVWVNVKQVSLSSPSGSVTLFKSTNGKSIDLSSLSQSGKQMYAALGVGNIPTKSYSQVQISLDNSVTVIPTGSTQGTTATFAGATGTTKTIAFSTTANGTQPIIAKFNLSQWSIKGNQVTATASDDSDSGGAGTGTQEPQDFEGVVSNLTGTAPTLSFDITEDGSTTHVTTDATTTIANSDGSANPVLANGAKVDVVGTVDATSLVLAASSVTVRVGNSGQQINRLVGTVASSSSTGFVINVSGCEGLLPSNSTANIAVTGTTTYLDANGISVTFAQFQTLAVTGTKISAQGAYDQPSNTLTATSISIRTDGEGGNGGGNGGGGGDHMAQVQGAVTSVDVANNAFVITISEYEGVALSKGASLSVAVSNTTKFNTGSISTLAVGNKVELLGSYANSVLTASSVNIQNGD